MTPDAPQPRSELADLRWRLVPGVRVLSRTWDDETAVFFQGAGETMVVSELGSAAIAGIAAGCADLPALEAWCRGRGLAAADEDLGATLLAVLEKLAAFEIIEPAP